MVPKLYQYLTGVLTVQVALGNPIASAPCPSGSPSPPSYAEAPKLGAVASESDICSHIGTDLLKLGGNAADALVGTVACVGVIGMYHSGKNIFDSVVCILYEACTKRHAKALEAAAS
jgi:gamma-glutamyltranspeptidase/glutathione hydrolase